MEPMRSYCQDVHRKKSLSTFWFPTATTMREKIFKAFAEAGHMAEKIPDAETLGDSFGAIIHADKLNDGFEKRKVGLGRSICPVRDIKP